MPAPARVLVADDDRFMRALVRQTLADGGLQVSEAADGRTTLAAVQADPPDVLVLDLMMPHLDGFQVLAALDAQGWLEQLQVIVLTGRDSQEVLTRAFEAGADDYIAKPFHVDEMLARVRAHVRIVRAARQLAQRQRDGQILVEIGQRLSSRLDLQSILHEVTTLVADVLAIDRCSIILLDAPAALQARVVAASDVAGLTDRPIDLSRYPEVRHVIDHRQPLVVGDVTIDPLLHPVKAQLEGVGVRSVALFPLLEGEACFGVLFLRSNQLREGLSDREMQIARIVASSAAIAITNARLFADVKADAAAKTHAAAVVEGRLRRVQRYAGFFESAADALCVVRPSGRLIYMNRKASELAGLTREEAQGQPVARVFGALDPGAVEGLLSQVPYGPAEPVDVPVQGGRLLCFSAAHLPEDAACSVTVREVTAERRNAKLAAVAELAGAAAHELNQPLTSVSGYAELILKRDPGDPLVRKAAQVILDQAGRMAEVVQRVGRVTRFETKAYVGQTRILDLDASDEDPER